MEILWIIILLGYAVCVAQSIFALTTKRPVMRRTALAALALALGAHTAGFDSRRPLGQSPLLAPRR
jgi:hypothetical protein